ncbi:hypothetical protein DERP_003114 [Dermatophagoides pteronyssinus]|uniref:Uncharacterized protein n=1 Tax=Dermatophagoides pteronyssinus TaxID=6956 RepID=A0ABQ8JIN6_DERPT|nr:hypothetical protein DERP_003114 [Dermatophagoides pteronyssinus]
MVNTKPKKLIRLKNNDRSASINMIKNIIEPNYCHDQWSIYQSNNMMMLMLIVIPMRTMKKNDTIFKSKVSPLLCNKCWFGWLIANFLGYEFTNQI